MAEYEPLILDRGEGCVLWDIDGRQYIDGVSSLWCNIHGHKHPKIDAAIRATSSRGPRHVAGEFPPDDHPTGEAIGRSRPAGLESRFFLRRRGHGRRGGRENGPAILAAAETRGLSRFLCNKNGTVPLCRQQDRGCFDRQECLSSFYRRGRRCYMGKNLLSGLGRRLSRRHAGERERGGRRAVPRHVPAAVVRDAPRAGARYVSHAR